MIKSMTKRTKIIIPVAAILAILIAGGLAYAFHQKKASGSASKSASTASSSMPPTTQPAAPVKPFSEPLPNALSRVTKKPFGIYITPATSPVQPERFTGYHTGVDFETTPAEQAGTVPVSAVCDGTLLMKKWATGYGGVAVESCALNGQPVTIIYGHLYINSVTPNVGDAMTSGEQFADLGQGYTTQTDGEREHLHLGVHLGTAINILGYVPDKSQLSAWVDATKYMQ